MLSPAPTDRHAPALNEASLPCAGESASMCPVPVSTPIGTASACVECGHVKHLSQFAPDARTCDIRRRTCASCRTDYVVVNAFRDEPRGRKTYPADNAQKGFRDKLRR